MRRWYGSGRRKSRFMHDEKITAYYRSLIDFDDPNDPLARMVCFSDRETAMKPGESCDPIGDLAHSRCANGRLIHRYPDRALLLVSDRCPAHCRFCLRKRILSQGESEISDQELEEALRYIAGHKEIKEAILSGGDPLSLTNSRLIEIVEALKLRAGVNSVRIHTRYPVYDPSRCDDFKAVAARVDTFVLHVNHRREITPEFCRAASVLRESSLLLSQSVLLKGVNDSFDEIAGLARGLVVAGILPYYLHYPDPVPGTAHFKIPLADAVRLANSLQGKLPGYMIPKLMLELSGGQGKVVLTGTRLERLASGNYSFTSPVSGKAVEYREI